MGYINKEFYNKQKIIVQQLLDNGSLYIITKDDKTSTFILWLDDKRIASSQHILKLYERIKE